MSAVVDPPRSLAAGDWYAVLGDEVTLLLPPGERSRVARLWELADSGASAEDLLDAVVRDGLRELSGFVLLEHGDVTRLIVRGEATVTLTTVGGSETIAYEPGSVWVERRVAGVRGGEVRLSAAAETAFTVPVPGVSRVGRIEWGLHEAGEEESSGRAAAVEPDERTSGEPEPEVPASVPLSFGQPADDPTPTGETPVVPAAPSWAPPAGDHDGHTSVGAPSPDHVGPARPGEQAAPPVLAHPVARLVLSTGEVLPVDRAVLVGRAPEARRFASHDQPRLVTVPSPHQEISSTHLEIRPGAGVDHGMAVVTDLGSTNGTVLVQPGLPPEELRAGVAVSLIPGAVLDLGDGVTIQVTDA